MIRLGFTGPLSGMTKKQRRRLRDLLEEIAGRGNAGEFHHCDLIGADAQAHDIAAGERFEIVLHPCNDPRLRAGKAAQRVEFAMHAMARCKALVQSVDIVIIAVGNPMNKLARFAMLQSGLKLIILTADGRMLFRTNPPAEQPQWSQP